MTQLSKLRVILIGGSSHSGKSTTAQVVARKLGWSHLSADSLARHPGRPWRVGPKLVPDHVSEHYRSLTVDELFTDVLQHYRRIWSDIETLIHTVSENRSMDRLILEGSALWPEFTADLGLENVKAVWLTTADRVFKERIYHSSQYEQVTEAEKYLIRKFLDRTVLYNQRMMSAIERLDLRYNLVQENDPVEQVVEKCLTLLD